ncbi:MAG TPA: glycosyl hydrolase family 28-related protein [Stellaceae bacterium]|nr:glycosyl hydrolase family 28-related protein [Stellaceae bacterium]
MTQSLLNRRGVMAAGAAVAMASLPAGLASAARTGPPVVGPARMISAADFGATGDGSTDDTQALQAALDETFGGDGGFLLIPPGTYRVTRTLRVLPKNGGNIGRHSGILAHGARILSAIDNRANVVEIVSGATVRFLLVEGLDILGMGKEEHGLYVECDHRDHYFYNFCLRDVVVQACGGDGCRMVGNVFEGQVANSYFRKNGGNGITFAHSDNGGILSSIHVFGCVFGDNGANGAALIHRCYDVAFHGCYFLLNGAFGLVAENGCTLLSNCGFENNHAQAADFEHGDAGINLNSFGTLVGCTGYSIFKQTHLLRAFVTKQVTMIGCSGGGDRAAAAAGLAVLKGIKSSSATVIGCNGAIESVGGFEALELGGAGGGVHLGSAWHSAILPRLGNYRLWIDQKGRLRLKDGIPSSDEDGAPVGA